MIELFIVGGIIGLVAVILGTMIALKVQYRFLVKIHVQQEAWQRAQEAHQRTWEVRQGKHALEVEKKLTMQVQELHGVWQEWEASDEERTAAIVDQYDALMGKLNVEHELARLPRIEETPLPLNDGDQCQQSFANWQPPSFYRANLSGRDLSYRYLGRVDLREAQLLGTSLYMADLSGACLAGANLAGADLSGANLAGADLRAANLAGANMLVADLHNAVLHSANLLGVRNLTTRQVYSAIYDSSTQLDEEVDITLLRIPSIRLTVFTESSPLVSLEPPAPVGLIEAPDAELEQSPAITPTASSMAKGVPSETPETQAASVEPPPVAPPETPLRPALSDMTLFIQEAVEAPLLLPLPRRPHR